MIGKFESTVHLAPISVSVRPIARQAIKRRWRGITSHLAGLGVATLDLCSGQMSRIVSEHKPRYCPSRLSANISFKFHSMKQKTTVVIIYTPTVKSSLNLWVIETDAIMSNLRWLLQRKWLTWWKYWLVFSRFSTIQMLAVRLWRIPRRVEWCKSLRLYRKLVSCIALSTHHHHWKEISSHASSRRCLWKMISLYTLRLDG